jgi:hypothetical protein
MCPLATCPLATLLREWSEFGHAVFHRRRYHPNMSTITVDVDEITKDALTKAAAQAGQTLSEYLIEAADERMNRNVLPPYHEILANHPEIAADLAAARRAALRSHAEVRAKVLAKYGAGA